jgi:membrane-associated protease RseP (regulator of RpoE activity)
LNLGVLIFIVAILVVIMIHEGGHFLVAKAFGFKASQYFLGFGPTVWSFKKGETEYGVKALPLGGFVKIVGMNPYEEVPPEDEPRAYGNKPRWQRALVIVAGSATHFVVAFFILLVAAMTLGFPTEKPSNKLATVQTEIDGKPSPASEAGLHLGDTIVGVGGRSTDSWFTIRDYIRSHGGQRATFTVAREGEDLDVVARLGTAIFDSSGKFVEYAPPGESLRATKPGETVAGFLGVQPDSIYETEGPVGAVGAAASQTWLATTESVKGMGDMFGQIFGGEIVDALKGSGERNFDEGPTGIIGAGRIASKTLEANRPIDLVYLIVYFTVFVGIMNLLPLPPLDGGHLAVIGYEGITRKKVDVRKLIPIAAAVIAFFVVLFFAVIYLDLARPLRLPQ